MSVLDEAAQELRFKIVLYGPGLSGKTSNLLYLYERTAPEDRGQLRSELADCDRTLSLDLAPRSLRRARGLRVRLHLVGVVGSVYYRPSLAWVCEGADGVLFVADSQRVRAEANAESLEQLEEHLARCGLDAARMPGVRQLNKRDLPEVLSVPELDALLPRPEWPLVEAVAHCGEGVFESLRTVVRALLPPP